MRNMVLILNEEQQFQLDLVIEHYVDEIGSVVKGVCIADSHLQADMDEMIILTQILKQLREGGEDVPIKL